MVILKPFNTHQLYGMFIYSIGIYDRHSNIPILFKQYQLVGSQYHHDVSQKHHAGSQK